MESSYLVSMQFEDFSTAELSPPNSPIFPSSPTLFYPGSPPSPSGVKGLHNNGASTVTMAPQSHNKPALSSTSRAQTACNVLNELERLHSFEHHVNDFGITANEESVDLNMDLFEELADIEYTPPLLLSPEDIKHFEVPVSQPEPVVSAPGPNLINVSSLAANINDTAKLSAEFKSIVESLSPTISTAPTNNMVATTTFGNLIHISGIPTTTVVGDECLVPVEFVGRASSVTEAGEAETMDLDGIVISNEMEFINERELFSLEELSAELVAEESNHTIDGKVTNATLVNGVLPQWAKSLTIPLDELDYELSKNVSTLDALLKGDVSAAKTCISSPGYVQEPFSPVSNISSEDEEDITMESVVEINEAKPVAAEPVKQERRGRKPAKAYRDPLTYVKDKALRKKEQNKTAATRYRQKKKEELTVTLAEEDELQKEHDELEKEKDSVAGELRIIRGLLRQMLEVRKKRISTSPSSSRVTASSLVQAQKVANRRK